MYLHTSELPNQLNRISNNLRSPLPCLCSPQHSQMYIFCIALSITGIPRAREGSPTHIALPQDNVSLLSGVELLGTISGGAQSSGPRNSLAHPRAVGVRHTPATCILLCFRIGTISSFLKLKHTSSVCSHSSPQSQHPTNTQPFSEEKSVLCHSLASTSFSG